MIGWAEFAKVSLSHRPTHSTSRLPGPPPPRPPRRCPAAASVAVAGAGAFVAVATCGARSVQIKTIRLFLVSSDEVLQPGFGLHGLFHCKTRRAVFLDDGQRAIALRTPCLHRGGIESAAIRAVADGQRGQHFAVIGIEHDTDVGFRAHGEQNVVLQVQPEAGRFAGTCRRGHTWLPISWSSNPPRRFSSRPRHPHTVFPSRRFGTVPSRRRHQSCRSPCHPWDQPP